MCWHGRLTSSSTHWALPCSASMWTSPHPGPCDDARQTMLGALAATLSADVDGRIAARRIQLGRSLMASVPQLVAETLWNVQSKCRSETVC